MWKDWPHTPVKTRLLFFYYDYPDDQNIFCYFFNANVSDFIHSPCECTQVWTRLLLSSWSGKYFVTFFNAQDVHFYLEQDHWHLRMSNLMPRQLVLLATVIPVEKMFKIAKGYLGIDYAIIENIKFENSRNAEAINRQILRVWSYRNNRNQLQVF